MPNKRLNLTPINLKAITSFLKKHWAPVLLGVVVESIFLVGWYSAKNAGSNKEIFNILQGETKGVSLNKSCITLKQQDDKLIYNLANLLRDSKYFYNNQVAVVNFINLPSSLDSLKDSQSIKVRKEVFIKALLPLIIQANKEVLEDRKKVLYLSNKMPKEELNDKDVEIFKQLSKKYNVKQQINTFWDVLSGVNALVVKVNTIPNSLVLAIAIKETGWGTSRFLKEGNSLFSEWTFVDHANAIAPLNKKPGAKYAVRKYKDLASSINSFFYNLNGGDNYKSFRNVRFKELSNPKGVSVYKLTNTLEHYAEMPNYAESLQSIIKGNNLTAYDKYNDIVDTKPICLYFS